MFIVDDPMLALIMRFVVKDNGLDESNKDFIQRQLTEIRQFVARFPKEQEQAKAMEWIARYARKYRQDWQKDVALAKFSVTRCPDCPLVGQNTSIQCTIHKQWLDLLQSYVENEINSREYVENTLSLLKKHKSHLRVTSYLKPDYFELPGARSNMLRQTGGLLFSVSGYS